MLSQTIRVDQYGAIERGIDSPHEGANVECAAPLGWFIREYDKTGNLLGVRPAKSSSEWYMNEVMWAVYAYLERCRRRVGHVTRKGEEPHIPGDMRYVAVP